ncbi:MAG TPA: glycosyltransferase family 4 protein [Candidatus Paceibacterota bacterium]|nr:glycosyltransferase family 4 protein [Candidatus Paceibacterota bacterium]
MKIILATPMYPPEMDGVAAYSKELAERLRNAHDITIVAYASTSENIAGVKLLTVSKRRPLGVRLPKFFWTLMRASRGADVIYVQNAVAAGLPAVIVGTLLHIPVVLKFVGDESWERAAQLRQTTKHLEEFLASNDGSFKIRTLRRVQRFTLRHASMVTTPSAYLADTLAHFYGVPRERLVVNYNAAEKPEVTPFEKAAVPHQLAATARLVEWKGIDGIIRAVALLVKKFPDIKLFIAGDGPEEAQLKALAKELQVANHVTFLGRVSRAETWHVRKTSEVYVLNSTYEGLPHTALTSFAAGIPIIATNIPGTDEAVYDEKSGLLVPAGDDTALARAIERLFEDAPLRAQLIAGGKKILEEKFSWSAHIATLLSLCESVRFKPRH